MIFIHLLPCLSLVILNCLLFSGMRKADKRKDRLRTGSMVALKDMGRSVSQDSRAEGGNTCRLLGSKLRWLQFEFGRIYNLFNLVLLNRMSSMGQTSRDITHCGQETLVRTLWNKKRSSMF